MGSSRGGWLGVGEAVTLDNCEREPIHLPGRVQGHGAMLIVNRAGRIVVQASANIGEVLGGSGAEQLMGRPLSAAVGESAADELVGIACGGPPAIRPQLLELTGGSLVMVQCFEPAPGLLGIDVERAPVRLPDGAEVSTYSAGVAAALAGTRDEASCVAAAVTLLKQATGFDRTWAYRFEADGRGVVVAEDGREDLTPFLGLHFPESDIPVQARTMYLTAGVRLIGDSLRDDVPLMPEINPVTGERTDLSGSDLRGISPMHVRYLRNMGVRTSMSVPIVIDGELWGLLSAHHYGDAHEVPILTRSRCETLGTLTAMQLSAVNRSRDSGEQADAERHLRQVAAQLGGASSATAGLVADPQALLDLCRADGVIVALSDQVERIGNIADLENVDELVETVSAFAIDGRDVVCVDGIAELGDAAAGFAPVVAGVLAICLSHRHRHWVVWTRAEHVEHVTWANRSRELVKRDPRGDLELGARESFERWAESVQGRAAAWSPADSEAAREVRAAIGKYAFVQAKQINERAEDLARVNEELDAFAYSAAHDLRQPVRAIAMRTEFLIEDLADRLTPDERESAQTVLRLTGHMNALVDSLLEYAKLDYAAHQTQRINLRDVLKDVHDLLGDANQGAVITADDATVDADPDVLRQVLFNLVWNAIKYADQAPVIHVGAMKLSARPPGANEHVRLLGDAEADPDVVFVRDNGIGIPQDDLESVFGLFRRLHQAGDYGGGSGAGLALCQRLVQRSGGAIWATSTVGEGSTFYFTTTGADAVAA